MIEDTPEPVISANSEVQEPAQAEMAPVQRKSVWRGLLWAEWFAHSRLLLCFLLLWLAGVWLLPLFGNPAWIFLLVGIYALLAGPAYGGGDVLDGAEEFTFALPATRKQRFIARTMMGGGSLLFLSLINLVALGLDFPQMLARIYVTAGLIEPAPILETGLLYGLIVALPFAVFAFSFSISAVAHSRWLILSAWFWGGLGSLALLQIGFWYEELLWEKANGYGSFPLLILAGAVVLWRGYLLYQKKEIAEPAVPISLPVRWWLWGVLFLMSFFLALMMLSSLAKHYLGVK